MSVSEKNRAKGKRDEFISGLGTKATSPLSVGTSAPTSVEIFHFKSITLQIVAHPTLQTPPFWP